MVDLPIVISYVNVYQRVVVSVRFRIRFLKISEDLKNPQKILVTDELLPSDSHADNNSNHIYTVTHSILISTFMIIHDISHSKMIIIKTLTIVIITMKLLVGGFKPSSTI